jgi:hypothetical protein
MTVENNKKYYKKPKHDQTIVIDDYTNRKRQLIDEE